MGKPGLGPVILLCMLIYLEHANIEVRLYAFGGFSCRWPGLEHAYC